MARAVFVVVMIPFRLKHERNQRRITVSREQTCT